MDKKYILDEIRRTAGENAGVPLGHRRFTRETGIKSADWGGRFWARWGDALREAGFQPNALQLAYKPDDLIERFIGFARELGHFPVVAELRMKASQDKSFPSHTVWRSHFGAKNSFAKRVVEYCSTRPDLKDVAAMCAPVPDAAETRSERVGARSEESFGFVYLIRSGRYYKVGRSNATGRRERELAIQLPEKAQRVHEIRTDDPAGIEAYWHNRFASKRKNGEWFDLVGADITAFKRRKFM